jgi:hypothetical protein
MGSRIKAMGKHQKLASAMLDSRITTCASQRINTTILTVFKEWDEKLPGFSLPPKLFTFTRDPTETTAGSVVL